MSNFDRLVDLMARLRSPSGCPWDKAQTPQSLKPYLIEEVYEVLDAIDRNDDAEIVEELGDLLLQIVFHAQIAREENRFTIDDVACAIADKLVRRHPHVFGDAEAGYAGPSPPKLGTHQSRGKPGQTAVFARRVAAPSAPLLLRRTTFREKPHGWI